MKYARRRGSVARLSGLRKLAIESLEDRRLMTITANYYPDYDVLKVMADAGEPLVIGSDAGLVTINGETSVDGISGLSAASVGGLWIVGNNATTFIDASQVTADVYTELASPIYEQPIVITLLGDGDVPFGLGSLPLAAGGGAPGDNSWNSNVPVTSAIESEMNGPRFAVMAQALIGDDWQDKLDIDDLETFLAGDNWRPMLTSELFSQSLDPDLVGDIATSILGSDWTDQLGVDDVAQFLSSGTWRQHLTKDTSRSDSMQAAAAAIGDSLKKYFAALDSGVYMSLEAVPWNTAFYQGGGDESSFGDGSGEEDSGDGFQMLSLMAAPTPATIYGTEMGDVIYGSNDVDIIYGGGGDDTIAGGAGDDVIYAGAGADWVTGDDGVDTIYGDIGDDTIFGNGGADKLYGGDDNDTLVGGDGNDLIYGGAGADNLFGLLGNDTEYGEDGADNVLDGLEGDAEFVSGGDNYFDGGDGIDTLGGGEGADTLIGGDGDDYLRGFFGSDKLEGGAGDDHLFNPEGADTFVFSGSASLGTDTLDTAPWGSIVFGKSVTLDFSGLDYGDNAHPLAGVYVDLTNSGATYSGVEDIINYNGASLSLDMEAAAPATFNVVGTKYNDTLIGNALPNTLTGNAGDDILTGADGFDSLNGGAGDDLLTGGNGNDTYYFSGSLSLGEDTVVEGSGGGSDTLNFQSLVFKDNLRSGVNVDLNDSTSQLALDHNGVTMSLILGTSASYVERLVGSNYDDRLRASPTTTHLGGAAGDDTFVYAGTSSFASGDITPGGGKDTLDFSGLDYGDGLSGSNALSLASGTSATWTFSAGGKSLPLTFVPNSITNVIGTAYADTITGSSANNRLEGRGGDDTLSGGGGDDSLIGGDGADSLNGGDGNDYLDGGNGSDSLIGGDGYDSFASDGSDPASAPNIAPINGGSPISLRKDQAFAVRIPVDDVQTSYSSLYFEVISAPGVAFADFDGAGPYQGVLRLIGAPVGSNHIKIRVTDSNGQYDEQTFDVDVDDFNEAPPSPDLIGILRSGPSAGTISANDGLQTARGDIEYDFDSGGAGDASLTTDGVFSWDPPDPPADNVYNTEFDEQWYKPYRFVVTAEDDGAGGGGRRSRQFTAYGVGAFADLYQSTLTQGQGVQTDGTRADPGTQSFLWPSLVPDSYFKIAVDATTNALAPGAGYTIYAFADASPTWNLVDGPSHASSFHLNSDGTFSYTPTSGFKGLDQFSYYVDSPGNWVDGIDDVETNHSTENIGNVAVVTIQVGEAAYATLSIHPDSSVNAASGNGVWVNNDDDNKNGRVDSSEIFGAIQGENDLTEVDLDYWLRDDVFESDVTAYFSLSYNTSSTPLRIWDSPTKGREIFPEGNDSPGTTWVITDLPEHVWVEGLSSGLATLTLHIEGPGTSVFTDMVTPPGSDAPIAEASLDLAINGAALSVTTLDPDPDKDDPDCGCDSDGASDDADKSTGNAAFSDSVGDGFSISYDPVSSEPVLAVTVDAPDSWTPSEARFVLTVGGQTKTFDFDDLDVVPGGKGQVFLPFDFSDAGGALATGSYDYQLQLQVGPSHTTVTTYSSKTPVVIDRHDHAGFGADWTFSGSDELIFQTNLAGTEIAADNEQITWMAADDKTYTFNVADISSSNGALAVGDPDASRLKKATGTDADTNSTPFLILTDKFGAKTLFDNRGLVTFKVDANKNVSEYHYVGTTRFVESIEYHATGRTATFDYNLDGGVPVSLHSYTNSDGDVSTFDYTDGRLTSITTDPNYGDETPLVKSFDYDSETGQLIKITRPGGDWTAYEYLDANLDPAGLDYTTLKIIHSDETPGNSADNPFDLLVYSFARPNATPSATWLPDNGDVGALRQSLGYGAQPGSGYFIDANGLRTDFTSDANGRITSSTNPLSQKVSHTYNAAGQITQMIEADPDGDGPLGALVTNYTYDDRGNETSVLYPDGTYESWEYDATFNKATSHTDVNGHVTLYGLDLHGNVTKITQVNGALDLVDDSQPDSVTRYEYSEPDNEDGIPAGLLLHAFDALNHDTFYEYYDSTDPDQRGHVKQITTAYGTDDASIERFTYDAAGNVLTDTQVIGLVDGELGNPETDDRTTIYEYDALNRVRRVTSPDPDGSGPLLKPITIYTYCNCGSLVSTTQVIGLVDGEEGNSETDDRTTSYEYDAQKRLIKTTSPDPDGPLGPLHAPITTRSYDSAGRLIAETQVVGEIDDPLHVENTETDDRVTRYVYDDSGRLISTILPNPDPDGDDSDPEDEAHPVTHTTYDAVGNVSSQTDALGNVTRYTYDSQNRLIRTETPDPDGEAGPLHSSTTNIMYNVDGSVDFTIDALGRITSFDYDDLGRQTVVTMPDPDGAGPLHAPQSITTYDVAGNVTSVREVVGEFDDPLGIENEETDDRITTYTYDAQNRVKTVTSPDPDGEYTGLPAPITTYAYNSAGELLAQAQVVGDIDATDDSDPDIITTYHYDNLGRQIRTTLPDPDLGDLAAAPYTAVTYGSDGSVETSRDALGNITTYTYDALGRQLTVTMPDPDGVGDLIAPVTRYAYDDAGQLESVTQVVGELDSDNASEPDRITSFAYDRLGRQILVTSPDPDVGDSNPAPRTAYTYDKNGNVMTMTQVMGALDNLDDTDPDHTTTYVYDSLGRTIYVIAPDPETGGNTIDSPLTTYIYDAGDQLIQTIDAMDNVTTNLYDALGRVVLTIMPNPVGGAGPDGFPGGEIDSSTPFTAYAYNEAGELLSQTDAAGNTTSFVYDNLGRILSSTVHNTDSDETTNYTYDALGNRHSLTDPVGNETTWTYDRLGRLTQEENELGDIRSFKYDDASQLVEKTDRDLRVTRYTYDTLGREVAETWYGTGGVTPVYAITYTYDNAGDQIQVSDPIATYDYEYDDAGRLQDETQTIAGLTVPIELESGYDDAGNRTGLTVSVNSATNFTNSYLYDTLNRQTQVTQSVAGVGVKQVAFGYNKVSRFDTISRSYTPTGDSMASIADGQYLYDDAGRLKGLSHINGATSFASYAWTWDKANRITAFSSSGHPGENATYDYDDAGQLKSVDSTHDESYTYDDNGNRETANDDDYVVEPNSNNQLSSDGTYEYGYDAEGNRSSRTLLVGNPISHAFEPTGETTIYSWDQRNRLVAVTTYDGPDVETATKLTDVRYTYDAFDRRMSKSVDSNGNGVIDRRELYSYDGQNVIFDFVDTDGDVGGGGGAAMTLATRYLYGPAVDQILAQEDLNVGATSALRVLWHLDDNLGTTRDLVKNTGAEYEHYSFDAFGKLLSVTDPGGSPIANPHTRYLYTGRELDTDTGLQYNRTRWYDSAVGQWISEDPIGFAAGSANLTGYVGNQVTRYVDPLGLIADEIDTSLVGFTMTKGRKPYEIAVNMVAELKPAANIGEPGKLYGTAGETFPGDQVHVKLEPICDKDGQWSIGIVDLYMDIKIELAQKVNGKDESAFQIAKTRRHEFFHAYAYTRPFRLVADQVAAANIQLHLVPKKDQEAAVKQLIPAMQGTAIEYLVARENLEKMRQIWHLDQLGDSIRGAGAADTYLRYVALHIPAFINSFENSTDMRFRDFNQNAGKLEMANTLIGQVNAFASQIEDKYVDKSKKILSDVLFK